jgi:hypothetical protein
MRVSYSFRAPRTRPAIGYPPPGLGRGASKHPTQEANPFAPSVAPREVEGALGHHDRRGVEAQLEPFERLARHLAVVAKRVERGLDRAA